MPLVRIDLPATTASHETTAISRAVHQSLVNLFNVPQDDMFHVIGRRAPDELVCNPQFLGIAHSDRVVFIQIACSPGRNVGLKEALYASIAAEIAKATSFKADDVIINLLETARENWSFGAGQAQYAVQDRVRPQLRS